ncbi:MAG TPA: CopG family transcriptional regulator [Blastocatellia bacterium]|nr:CopG family transcriptional regulator [Blastocatellia bacterium]
MKKNPLAAALNKARGDKAAPTAGATEPKGDRPTKFKNPDYIQTTVYLPRTQHKALKVALIQDDLEFSDLIEQLIDQWLEGRQK